MRTVQCRSRTKEELWLDERRENCIRTYIAQRLHQYYLATSNGISDFDRMKVLFAKKELEHLLQFIDDLDEKLPVRD